MKLLSRKWRSDGTIDYLKSENILFSRSKNNIGLCSAINEAVKLSKFNFIVYSHDDCYFCPSGTQFYMMKS